MIHGCLFEAINISVTAILNQIYLVTGEMTKVFEINSIFDVLLYKTLCMLKSSGLVILLSIYVTRALFKLSQTLTVFNPCLYF